MNGDGEVETCASKDVNSQPLTTVQQQNAILTIESVCYYGVGKESSYEFLKM